MNKLLFKLSFFFSLFYLISQSWALPSCPSSGYFHNCYSVWTSPSGITYKGDYKNNKRNGQFEVLYPNGDVFIGKYKDDKRHGLGTYIYIKGDKFIGNHRNGKANGHGTYNFANGDKYVGNHKNDAANGYGTYMFANGDKYVGQFKDNKKNGEGTYTFANGKVTEGIWENGKFMFSKRLTKTSNPKIEGYKAFCSEIGFTPGTEKFGECVVEAMKKG